MSGNEELVLGIAARRSAPNQAIKSIEELRHVSVDSSVGEQTVAALIGLGDQLGRIEALLRSIERNGRDGGAS